MPNHCYQNVSIIGPEPLVRALSFDLSNFCSMVKPMPLEVYNDHLGDVPAWYDWRVKNWGTKWDLCEVDNVRCVHSDVESLILEFKCWTAWSPPVPVWDRLVNELDCVVAADYRDEGGLFEGEYNCSDKRWRPEDEIS
jgi:hypothetical protein